MSRPPSPPRILKNAEERLFPKLTPAQMARIASHGRRRPINNGEVLIDVGDKRVPFFVVVDGEVDVLQVAGHEETFIVAHTPGSFSGEANLMSGRPSVARLRVAEPGEVIELERD